jgi:hypothetical protein
MLRKLLSFALAAEACAPKANGDKSGILGACVC